MANKYDFCKYVTVESSYDLYQQGKYGNINAFLWKTPLQDKSWQKRDLQNVDTLKGVAKDIINLSSLMSNTTYGKTLYRGTNESYFDMDSIREGEALELKGFSSASDSLEVANSFTTNDSNSKGIVFKIHIPEGGKLCKMENSTFSFEEETLLPPARYIVNSVTIDETGKYHVELEQSEVLDVKDLIHDGLEHIKSSLPTFSLIKKAQISQLEKQVNNYIAHQPKPDFEPPKKEDESEIITRIPELMNMQVEDKVQDTPTISQDLYKEDKLQVDAEGFDMED